jgi:hypothetical protein
MLLPPRSLASRGLGSGFEALLTRRQQVAGVPGGSSDAGGSVHPGSWCVWPSSPDHFFLRRSRWPVILTCLTFVKGCGTTER